MFRFLKDFIWFIKESFSFMAGERDFLFFKSLIPKAIWFCKEQQNWYKLTPQKRETWYLSGEGRTMYL